MSSSSLSSSPPPCADVKGDVYASTQDFFDKLQGLVLTRTTTTTTTTTKTGEQPVPKDILNTSSSDTSSTSTSSRTAISSSNNAGKRVQKENETNSSVIVVKYCFRNNNNINNNNNNSNKKGDDEKVPTRFVFFPVLNDATETHETKMIRVVTDNTTNNNTNNNNNNNNDNNENGNPKVDLTLQFQNQDDFLQLCNQRVKPLDLAIKGKLTVMGDRSKLIPLKNILDLVADKLRQQQQQQQQFATTETTTTTTTMAPSEENANKKKKDARATTTINRRNSFGDFVSRRGLRKGINNESKQQTTIPQQQLGSVFEEEEKEQLNNNNNNDTDEVDDISPTKSSSSTELESQIALLSAKCARLEAQNILVAAQQLDILTRIVAWTMSLLSLYLYWKTLWWAFAKFNSDNDNNDDNNDNVVGEKWYVATAAAAVAKMKIVWEQATPTATVEWANEIKTAFCSLVTSQITFFQAIGTALQPYWTTTTSAWLTLLSKYVLAVMPFVYNHMTHGLAHRRWEVFTVAAIIIIRTKLVRRRERLFMSKDDADQEPASSSSVNDSSNKIHDFGSHMSEDAIWEANYEVSARYLYMSILRLRGLWTKSAQYLSSRADFVPASYVRELKKLQDETPSTEWKDVEHILKKRSKVLQHLTDIDPKPLASASIGQVHTAVLRKTGEKVVVKVQHPFARTLLGDDFWSLKVIARVVAWLEPEYGFFEVLMREWAVEARKELDFEQELANIESAGAAIAQLPGNNMNHKNCSGGGSGGGGGGGCSPLHDMGQLKTNGSSTSKQQQQQVPFWVEIPKAYPEYSDRDVLVMSFCEGSRIDDLEQLKEWNIPHEAIMDGMAQAFAHMMYVTDIFSGDPHPGNMLIRPTTDPASGEEGFTLVLLDWGLAKRLPEEKRIAFCQMAYAAATFDFGLMLDAFTTMGLKMKRENVAEDMEGLRFLLREMAPREKARSRIKAKLKTDRKRLMSRKRGERVTVESKAYPGEFFFFVRTNELLHGLGSRLNVEMNYLDVIRPYAERGLALSAVYRHDENIVNPLSDLELHDEILQAKVEHVVHELDQLGEISGAQVCVIDSGGRALVNVASGHMGGLKRELDMRQDAVVLGFSCTKAVTATVAHIMVEEGYLSYDEPLCERVWPAFCPQEEAPEAVIEALEDDDDRSSVQERWRWKREVTLRHVLTHTSGLYSALPQSLTIKSLADCEACCHAFEYNPDEPDHTLLPKVQPGEQCQYHAISFGWLVAGALRGAYKLRHKHSKVTYEQVYQAMLEPRLTEATLKSGFRPCGGAGDHPMALTDAKVDMTRILQLRREAEAMGEREGGSDDETTKIDDGNQNANTENLITDVRKSMKGKEFMLDPRIWNCAQARDGNVPAAGGRFSATGLASFYRELGTGTILRSETLGNATKATVQESSLQALQGQTDMNDYDNTEEVDNDGRRQSNFGLGYQLLFFDSSSEAFGHAGVGGSIGFHHKNSGVSVGIMLNNAGGDKDTAKKIVNTIAHHYGWK